MERGEIHEWLRHRVASLRRERLTMALVAGVFGAVVTGVTTTIGTAILVGVIGQTFKIGRAWLDWQTDFPSSPLNIALVAVAVLALQALGFRRRDEEYIFHVSRIDWRASENIGALLSFLWALLLDLLHSGPSLILHAREQLRQRRQLSDIDRQVCGDILHVLHCNDHRVAFAKLVELVPAFGHDTHLPQLLLIPGIMHLPSDPPGLSLSTELRQALGTPTTAQRRAARATPREEPRHPDAEAFFLLGLAPNADEDEVKQAYRELRKGLPSEPGQMSPEQKAHSREINRAYGQIMDRLRG